MLPTYSLTVFDFFQHDFGSHQVVARKFSLGDEEHPAWAALRFSSSCGAKFLVLYIPSGIPQLEVAGHLLHHVPDIVKGFDEEASECVWTRKVYVYVPVSVSDDDAESLAEHGREHDLVVSVVDVDRINARWENTAPLAFISHDWRDKDTVAQPLAYEFGRMFQIKVWYDQFMVHAGENLDITIQAGLQRAKYCIAVLSEHRLSNTGWASKELEYAMRNEEELHRKVVIPLSVGLTAGQIEAAWPQLSDRVVISWELGVERVAAELARAMGHGEPLFLNLPKEEA